jgi:endogenous inhibitor of DNA gyrase (YacG/DUF329 family)
MALMGQNTCPICGTTFARDAPRASFPFCSNRCRMIDLGNWLDGAYRLPADQEEVFSENSEAPPAGGTPPGGRDER